MQPWREKYLVFGSPFIGAEERAEVMACIDSGWLGTGPRVQRFEQDFRRYVGAAHAVAVSSGTAALHLALRELGLEPGSEVILPAMTFVASANAVVHAGYRPVFADCDARTFNIDVKDVERRIGPRTRALLPVHFAGRPCEMEPLMALAERHGLRVVEDCAHAIESTYAGRHCGTFGDFGAFSFYVTKNVTTVEGGMVTARDEAQADRVKIAALHGMSKDAWKRFSDDGHVHYDVQSPGFKYNLTDLAASFGIHQLARVDAMHARRARLWDFYQRELRDLPLQLPEPPAPGTRHAFHLFTCLTHDGFSRDAVIRGLHGLRIGSGVHYRAIHLHKYYREAFPSHCPNAASIGERTFSIPLSGALSDDDAADVVRALRAVLA